MINGTADQILFFKGSCFAPVLELDRAEVTSANVRLVCRIKLLRKLTVREVVFGIICSTAERSGIKT